MAVTIQKIIGSSEGNADNGLTARNKINSNFQNLVDAILSIQVESGTTSFENLTGKPSTLQGYGITDAASSIHSHEFSTITNKPTTLSGYGIADSYDKTQVDTLLSGKMSSAIFNDLFEKVNIGTELAPVYAIKAKYDFYGIGEVSAYGIGSGGSSSGGLIQTVYGYAGLDAVYDDANYTETFNAYTINRLHSRVSLVESGSAMSITTIGTGNAVTSLTKSGTVITVNLGNSFSLSGHTHTFNALTDKPTTLSGYGIVDAVDITTYGNHVISNLHLTDAQRNVLALLSVVDGKLKSTADFYSEGEVSAYGVGIGSGGSGLIQTVYGYTNLGGTYSDSTLTDTFNAYTINQLASRITNLEGGTSSNISISTIGTGNAITTATKSGDVITFAKDSTFVLTSDYRLSNARYNPYALTFTGYLSAVYDGSNSVSIALPTKLSQFTNDIGAGTSITKAQVEGVLTGTITSHTHNYLTGNQTISVTGDATGSGATSIALTLANSGVTIGTYRSITVDSKGRVTAGTNPTTLAGYGIIDAAALSHTHNYAGSTSAGGKANAVANQLAFSGYSTLRYDGSTAVTIPIPNNTNQLTNGAGYITASGSITGNAGTATALQNSRTIWGQSFNGSANVTGSLSSVTDVAMSGTLSIGSAQFIYDSGTNTIRVQKSDGTAIGFYSTGEVSSYGVGSNNGTAYISKALSLSSTLTTASDIFSGGNIHLNNEKYLKGKDSNGVYYQLFGVDSANYVKYGDSGLTSVFKGAGILMSTASKTNIVKLYDTISLNANTAVTGTITSTGSGTFNGGSFSSLRSLKTIHKDWQGNALDEIAKFQIRDFNYKNQLDCNRTLGFIVDEIPESMSDYVLANKDKNAINLYTLHALAFLGLQETKSEVDKLKEKIISLKNEIDYLKIKLN